METCKDIALAQQLLYLSYTELTPHPTWFLTETTKNSIGGKPALGAAQIGNIVASQSHALAALATLVPCSVIDRQVL